MHTISIYIYELFTKMKSTHVHKIQIHAYMYIQHTKGWLWIYLFLPFNKTNSFSFPCNGCNFFHLNILILIYPHEKKKLMPLTRSSINTIKVHTQTEANFMYKYICVTYKCKAPHISTKFLIQSPDGAIFFGVHNNG